MNVLSMACACRGQFNGPDSINVQQLLCLTAQTYYS